jgi:peptidoglycan/LPS O-acetylase OafA/YrhL
MTSTRTKFANNPTQGRIPELDGLRGIAILFVVVWHYFYFYPDPNHRPTALLHKLYVYFERCIAVGWSGVDLFFVLSGFLIGGILLDVRTSPFYFKTFYLRRFFRIIPIYYAWVTLYVFLAILSFAFGRHTDALGEPKIWYDVGAHFLFLQNLGFIHYSGLGSAWFVSTWSLAVEEQFYLAAPMIIRWLSSRVLVGFLISVFLLAPLLRVLVHFSFPPTASLDLAYVLMPCRADSLAVGMLVAILWRRPQSHRWLQNNPSTVYLLVGIFLTGIVLLDDYSPSHHSIVMQSVGFSWLAIFFGLILILTLVSPRGPIASLARMSWLHELGRVSYCLYIIHQAVNLFCHAILQPTPDSTNDWKVLAVPTVAIVLSYAIAKLSWIYLEQPLLRRGHTFKY